MATPSAKRRRLDTAAQTLSKPFQSPFKGSTSSSDKTSEVARAEHEIEKNKGLGEDGGSRLAKSRSSPRSSNSTPVGTKSVTRKRFVSPFSTSSSNVDADIAPLLGRQRDLDQQLRELKKELEIVEQARKIEAESENRQPGGTIDAELQGLTRKWKAASRQASEELYGTVRDRVNRMGGLKAWKEIQKRQGQFQNAFDDPPPYTKGGNDEGDDVDDDARKAKKQDLYAEYGIEPETAIEKSQRETQAPVEDPEQEDEFTMAMMLATLNVDLKVIGYDKQQQRWEDL